MDRALEKGYRTADNAPAIGFHIPQMAHCLSCACYATTKTKYYPGCFFIAFTLFLLFVFWPLAIFVCFCDGIKDCYHYC